MDAIRTVRMGMLGLLLAGLTGCGGSKQTEAQKGLAINSPEREALLYGLTDREKHRIDLELDRHAAGEITDKDLIEVAGQLHKQALSRLAAEDALEQMAAERARAMEARREREKRLAERDRGGDKPVEAAGK